jgi:hypothetical protein
MSASTQSKLGVIDLPTALGRCEFQPEINMLIDRRASIELAITTLQEAGKLVEASKLFAHALPKREAVWWACVCAHYSEPVDIAEADRRAREIAADWVRKQDDDLRYAAYKQAGETGFQSAHAWAAVAAFWSGASISPRGTTPMAPGAHLTGLAVAGAVALAAVRGGAERQTERLQLFLASARDIAAGGGGRIGREAT